MIGEALATLEPPDLVRDRAFAHVREAIITGRIAPGARLIERELCEALGISRPSVREVIRRLEAERLVAVEPRRGPVVVRLTAEEAAQIYEIRGLIESLLYRRFAERASERDMAALERLLARLKRAAGAGAHAEIVALTRELNAHLVAVADHAVAGDLLAQLDARISWLRMQAMAVPGRLRESLAEMDTVMKLVRERDGDGAAARIARSVANARDAALTQIAGGSPSDAVVPKARAAVSSKSRKRA